MIRAGELAAPAWVVTAVALAVLLAAVTATEGRWTTPRLERVPGRRLGRAGGAAGRTLTAVGGALGVVSAVAVTAIALLGPPDRLANAAPPLVHVLLWGAGPLLALVVGDWWRIVGPAPALARAAGGWAPPLRGVDTYPAAALLAAYGWLVTVHPAGDDPRVLGQAIVVYTAVLGIGALWAGRGWIVSADPFATLFGAIGGLGALRRTDDGHVELRVSFTAPSAVPARPAIAAVLLVALGIAAFTAVSRTVPWGQLRSLAATGSGALLIDTAGLVAAIVVMGALYMWAWRDAARHSSATIAELASWFTPVLVPVVVAFTVSLAAGPVLTELVRLPRLLADPFGAGTVGIVRPPPVRVVIGAQAVALLAGHVAALLILRDRAASYRGDLVRTLTAPVAVLAAYLAVGTLTLFGG